MKHKNIILKINKDKLKSIAIRLIPFLAGCFILAFIFVKLLVPAALGLITYLLYVYNISTLITDINFKFISGVVFLFIGYKIFEAIAIVFIKIFNAVINYSSQKQNSEEKK